MHKNRKGTHQKLREFQMHEQHKARHAKSVSLLTANKYFIPYFVLEIWCSPFVNVFDRLVPHQ